MRGFTVTKNMKVQFSQTASQKTIIQSNAIRYLIIIGSLVMLLHYNKFLLVTYPVYSTFTCH